MKNEKSKKAKKITKIFATPQKKIARAREKKREITMLFRREWFDSTAFEQNTKTNAREQTNNEFRRSEFDLFTMISTGFVRIISLAGL